VASARNGDRGEGDGQPPSDPDLTVLVKRMEAVLPLLSMAVEREDSTTLLAIIMLVLAIRALADHFGGVDS